MSYIICVQWTGTYTLFSTNPPNLSWICSDAVLSLLRARRLLFKQDVFGPCDSSCHYQAVLRVLGDVGPDGARHLCICAGPVPISTGRNARPPSCICAGWRARTGVTSVRTESFIKFLHLLVPTSYIWLILGNAIVIYVHWYLFSVCDMTFCASSHNRQMAFMGHALTHFVGPFGACAAPRACPINAMRDPLHFQ